MFLRQVAAGNLGGSMIVASELSQVYGEESDLQRFSSMASIEFSGVDSKLVGLRQQAPIRFLFPELEAMGARSVVWVKSQVEEWCAQKVAAALC